MKETPVRLTSKQRLALSRIAQTADHEGYVPDVDIWRGPTEDYGKHGALVNRDTALSLERRGLVIVLGSDPAWVEQITPEGRAIAAATT